MIFSLEDHPTDRLFSLTGATLAVHWFQGLARHQIYQDGRFNDGLEQDSKPDPLNQCQMLFQLSYLSYMSTLK